MPNTPHRTRLSIGVDKHDILGVLAFARGVHTKTSANTTTFTALPVSLAALLGQITDLDASQQVVTSTKAKGTAADRDRKRDVLWSSLELIEAYGQSLCDASPEQAATIAEMCGFKVSAVGAHAKAILAATLTATPGTAKLHANASLLVASGKGTSKARIFLWRYTTDGGKTFISVDGTPVAEIVIPNLPLGTTVGFQVCAKDADAQGEWSQTVNLFVH